MAGELATSPKPYPEQKRERRRRDRLRMIRRAHEVARRWYCEPGLCGCRTWQEVHQKRWEAARILFDNLKHLSGFWSMNPRRSQGALTLQERRAYLSTREEMVDQGLVDRGRRRWRPPRRRAHGACAEP